MPHPDYRTCRACGRRQPEPGQLSWTRLCEECGPQIQTAHNLQLHVHRGPWFEQWRHRVAASVGAVLIDNTEGTA